MQILCTYDIKLEVFLKQLVKYVIDEYGKELDLHRLKTIELVPKESFAYGTDGRCTHEGTQIIVTSRLYENLSSLNLQELVGTQSLNILVNTLYHELGHINDWSKLPLLYSAANEMINADLNYDTMENLDRSLPCFFWLEYIAEKRSSSTNLTSNKEFCEDFVARDWHSFRFNFEHADESNFFYLIKVIPYFMARTLNINERVFYLQHMKNPLLKQLVEELDIEITRLETLSMLDDPAELSELYNIIRKFFYKFRIAFG